MFENIEIMVLITFLLTIQAKLLTQHCKHPLYDAKHAGEGILSFTRTNNVNSTFTTHSMQLFAAAVRATIWHMLAFLSNCLSNKFE